MKFKLLSDIKVSIIFVLIFLVGPLYTSKGVSIILLNLIDFSALAEGYVFLIIDFAIAFVLSNIIVWWYDKNHAKRK